ncbi:hypothetical protein ABZP36_024618 [Zizania latifolia]
MCLLFGGALCLEVYAIGMMLISYWTYAEPSDLPEHQFNEKILLWHIATDLCFYHDDGEDANAKLAEYVGVSWAVSNNMLFLLVARPFMLTAGIGKKVTSCLLNGEARPPHLVRFLSTYGSTAAVGRCLS